MLDKLMDSYYENYKKILIIPLFLLFFNLCVIGYTWYSTGSPVYLDSSLKGGVSLTITYEQDLDVGLLEQSLKEGLGTSDVRVVKLRDNIGSRTIGYEVQAEEDVASQDIISVLEDFIGTSIGEDMVSFGRQTSSIGTSLIGLGVRLLFIGFLFTMVVTFYYFRNIIPSLSITFSTVSDIIAIIAFLDLFHISFSTATIGALLMIIGYSTDSDILLATNILKRRDDSLKNRMRRAIGTELTMDVVAIVTFSLMYFFSTVYIIKHIALILLLGIIFDIVDTWCGNAVLQRFYLEKVKKE